MELTLKNQLEEAVAKRRWRRVFFALYAPVYARYALYVALFCIFGLILPNLQCFMLTLAVAYVIAIFTWYPRIWRVYRETFRNSGAFDHPTVVHLTDTFIDLNCGENSSKNEYRVFSGYIELKDTIALINQKAIAAVFEKTYFADDGKEFIQCLEKAGVKKLEFWGFKRWWLVFLPVVFMALLVVAHVFEVHKRCWRHEHGSTVTCASNLKQLMCGFLIFSSDLREVGKSAIFQSFPLDEMVDEGYVNESIGGCPTSSVGYAYVPYNRPLDHNSRTAASTPVMWDFIIGCHRKTSRLPWRKPITLTVVVFEDQHCTCEENLTCHMDIYNKYSPSMSQNDAEALRKICEEYDGMEQ